MREPGLGVASSRGGGGETAAVYRGQKRAYFFCCPFCKSLSQLDGVTMRKLITYIIYGILRNASEMLLSVKVLHYDEKVSII